jgi:hypothetical protein
MVLGRRARHRRAADVDVLDGLLEACALDAVCAHRLGMVRLVAQRQQPAMDDRMQGLDPSVHHFGEVRQLRHVGDLKVRVAQRLGRATRRDQLDAVLRQPLGEIGQSGLVRNGKQRAADRAERHGDSRVGGYEGSYFARRQKRSGRMTPLFSSPCKGEVDPPKADRVGVRGMTPP